MTKISNQNCTFVQLRGRDTRLSPKGAEKIHTGISSTQIEFRHNHMVYTHASASGTRPFVASCKLQKYS